MLLDTELSGNQRHYAEIVRSSSQSLLTIINDILDFSKIEAGKLTLEKLDFDLYALLDEFAGQFAAGFKEKGIEFIYAVSPNVPYRVCGDPGRLHQILTNLVGNALKFTNEGEIVMKVTLLSENKNNALIHFSIKDTGIGIAPEYLNSIFQKFSQEDSTITRKFGGTGLGLSISKQLTEMMGGEIGVSSEKGKGSEFWFTANFTRQAGQENHITIPAEIRGTRILVVDNNADNRSVIGMYLQNWSLRPEETPNVFDALEAIKQARDSEDPFKAVILDMQLPGITLARAIKSDKTLKDIHLILMTPFDQMINEKKMKENGFSACLTKPLKQSELFDCLVMLFIR